MGFNDTLRNTGEKHLSAFIDSPTLAAKPTRLYLAATKLDFSSCSDQRNGELMGMLLRERSEAERKAL